MTKKESGYKVIVSESLVDYIGQRTDYTNIGNAFGGVPGCASPLESEGCSFSGSGRPVGRTGGKLKAGTEKYRHDGTDHGK